MKIVFIGDSITEGFNTEKYLKNFNIINKGISGDNTTGVLSRLSIDVIELNPKKVFVLIGTNDFALNKSVEEIKNNIEQISAKLKSELNSPEIYLTSVLPTRNINDRPNDKIKELISRIKNISNKHGCFYFDLHKHMEDDEGKLKEDYTDDGLHLSDKAYRMWAEIIKGKII